MDFLQYLIPVITAILGFLTGLVTPWIKWRIELRRARLKDRRALFAAVRTLLASPPDLKKFRRNPLWSQVRPFVTENTRGTVEGEFDSRGNEIVQFVDGPFGGVNPYAHEVLLDIAAYEKKTGLI